MSIKHTTRCVARESRVYAMPDTYLPTHYPAKHRTRLFFVVYLRARHYSYPVSRPTRAIFPPDDSHVAIFRLERDDGLINSPEAHSTKTSSVRARDNFFYLSAYIARAQTTPCSALPPVLDLTQLSKRACFFRFVFCGKRKK